MRRYRIGVLNPGDHVMSVEADRLVIRRANGEVDILRLEADESGIPRIDNSATLTVGYGNGVVSVAAGGSEAMPGGQGRRGRRKGTTSSTDDEIIVGSF